MAPPGQDWAKKHWQFFEFWVKMSAEMKSSGTRIGIEDLLGPLNDVEQKNAPKQLFYAGDLSLIEAGPACRSSVPERHHGTD